LERVCNVNELSSNSGASFLWNRNFNYWTRFVKILRLSIWTLWQVPLFAFSNLVAKLPGWCGGVLREKYLDHVPISHSAT
jgi:hypothetical protein